MSSLERLVLDNSEQMILLVDPESLQIVMAQSHRAAEPRLFRRGIARQDDPRRGKCVAGCLLLGRGARRPVLEHRVPGRFVLLRRRVDARRQQVDPDGRTGRPLAGRSFRPRSFRKSIGSRTIWRGPPRSCAQRSNRRVTASWSSTGRGGLRA